MTDVVYGIYNKMQQSKYRVHDYCYILYRSYVRDNDAIVEMISHVCDGKTLVDNTKSSWNNE